MLSSGELYSLVISTAATEEDIKKVVRTDGTVFCCKHGISQSLPIHAAGWNINLLDPAVVQCIITAYPDGANLVNKFGDLPIHKACAAPPKNECLVNLDNFYGILEANPTGLQVQNLKGQLPLHVQCCNMHPTAAVLVEVLLDEYPAAVEAKDNLGYLPLHTAVCKSKSKSDVVELLVNAYPLGCAVKDKKG